MLKVNSVFSRPLAPHLTVYSSQITSVFSIWHRITGVSLTLILFTSLLILKVISNKYYIQILEISVNLWVLQAFFINLTLFFSYHLLNGLRHITWDLGFILSSLNIKMSVRVLVLALFVIGLFIIYKTIL